MREVLIITPDESLARNLRWHLEDAGYVTALSSSLEESFFSVGRSEPYLVIVDVESIPDQISTAKSFLSWFHRRSPVLLLANCIFHELETECDGCLPREVDRDQLLSCIGGLQQHS